MYVAMERCGKLQNFAAQGSGIQGCKPGNTPKNWPSETFEKVFAQALIVC